MTAEEILAALKFERVGPDPDDRHRDIWVYQEHLPNVRIYLPPSPSVPSVLYAIYDAGADKLRERLRELRHISDTLIKPTDSTTFEPATPEAP